MQTLNALLLKSTIIHNGLNTQVDILIFCYFAIVHTHSKQKSQKTNVSVREKMKSKIN